MSDDARGGLEIRAPSITGCLLLRFACCYLALYSVVVASELAFAGAPRGWLRRIGDGWAAPLRLAAIAVAGTAIWTLVARRRSDRPARALRTGCRYLLAYVALHHAVTFALRHELPPLRAQDLVTPVGQRRPDEMVAAFFGWSPVVTSFLGAVCASCAALLLCRRTALLGSLVLGGVLTNALLLGLLLDAGHVSMSAHLLVVTAIVIAPHARRLAAVHVLGRGAPPAEPDAPRAGPREIAAKAGAVAVFLASPLLLVARERGALWPERHELAGLYAVAVFERDRELQPPHAGDAQRWRCVIIDDTGTILHARFGTGEWRAYPISIDAESGTWRIAGGRASTWRDRSSATRLDLGAWTGELRHVHTDDGLLLVGKLARRYVRLTLRRVDPRRDFKLYTHR